jgi:transcriptional regulator with XRE-family HTH domain
MSATREQLLSEFIDAWNAGERPDVDDYIARVPAEEQQALGDHLATFLTFAPTPEYSDAALAAIRAEVAEAVGAEEEPGLFAALLVRLRERLGMDTAEVADALVGELGLREEQAPKTAGYLARLESGKLEPARVSRRVFEALGKVFRLPVSDLEGAADRGTWSVRVANAAPVFRATEDAAARAARHLDVLADALAAPGGEARDEVDDLFLGGR